MNPCPQREIAPARDVLSLGRGVGAVAATYGYFLVFAQFGLLRAIEEALHRDHLKPVLAAMGAAGILGSVLTARLFGRSRAKKLMAAGFVIAGGAALASVKGATPVAWVALAAVTGFGMAVVTVGLAAMLRDEVGARRLGWCVGVGTGLAYALCNVPGIFDAAPEKQALMGVVAALAGGIFVAGFSPADCGAGPLPGSGDPPPRLALWVGGFALLVAADAAMFHQIQHTPVLRADTWTGSAQLWRNAAAHLVAGIAAGLVFDRGRLGAALLAAALGLGLGGTLIFAGHGGVGAPLYAAAVSVYSAGLVFFAARTGRPGLAALVFAGAGWIGSAAGIAWAGGY